MERIRMSCVVLMLVAWGCGEPPAARPPEATSSVAPRPQPPWLQELGVGLHPSSQGVTVRSAGRQSVAEAVVPDAVEDVTAHWVARLRSEATVMQADQGLAQAVIVGRTPRGDRVVVSVEGAPAGRSCRTTVVVTRRRE